MRLPAHTCNNVAFGFAEMCSALSNSSYALARHSTPTTRRPLRRALDISQPPFAPISNTIPSFDAASSRSLPINGHVLDLLYGNPYAGASAYSDTRSRVRLMFQVRRVFERTVQTHRPSFGSTLLAARVGFCGVFFEPAREPGRLRSSTTRGSCRGGAGTAPRPRAGERGVSIGLSRTAGCAPRGRGREAVRAGPPEARRDGAARRPVPTPPRVRRRRSEAVRPIDSIAGPRRGHGMRPRSPRPRAKAVRRAARPDDAPRRLSRFDSLVARGPVARFGRKPSRALDFSGDVQGGGSGTP